MWLCAFTCSSLHVLVTSDSVESQSVSYDFVDRFDWLKRGSKLNSRQCQDVIVQELCESRGGRPELSVLTSLLASVDVKIY